MTMQNDEIPVLDGSNSTTPMLNDRTYNFAKWLTQVAFPAFGTLYFALGTIWGFPAIEEVLGTVVAVEAFLGVVLGLSNRSYAKSEARYDGTLDVHQPEDGSKLFKLNLNSDPNDLQAKDEVVFKVKTGI